MSQIQLLRSHSHTILAAESQRQGRAVTSQIHSSKPRLEVLLRQSGRCQESRGHTFTQYSKQSKGRAEQSHNTLPALKQHFGACTTQTHPNGDNARKSHCHTSHTVTQAHSPNKVASRRMCKQGCTTSAARDASRTKLGADSCRRVSHEYHTSARFASGTCVTR